MPQIRIADTPVASIKLGTSQVQRAYLGTTILWTPSLVWTGSPASYSLTARSSTWGPALVPAGRTVHWDAAHEASFTYRPNTNRVLKWDDRSGNDWWLAEPQPGTNIQLPSRVIGYNGLPVIHFEADQFMVHWIDSGTPAQINLPQPITVHIVAAAIPYSGYPTGMIGGQGFLAGGMQVTALDDRRLLFAAGNGVFYPYDTDQHVITGVFNGAASIQRIDGVQVGTGDPGTAELTRLQIGITHQLMDLTVCEIVFYNRVLTGPEIAYNENLLQEKWFKPAGVWTGSAAEVTIEGSARTWFTGTAPAFKATDIETCFGWWDASDLSTFTFSSGVSVLQWRDKTAAGNHLGCVNTEIEPDRAGTMNGLGVVSFDGNAWMLIKPEPGVALPSPRSTIFIVTKVNSYAAPPPDTYGVLAATDGLSIWRYSQAAGGGHADKIGIGAGVTAEFVVSDIPHLFTVVFDRVLSQQRIDRIQVGTVNTGPLVGGPLRVGTGTFASFSMVGQIAEICIYNRTLNSTEINEVEAYLDGKWFGPPAPQTWPGTASAVTITATSTVWSIVGVPGAPTLTTAAPSNAQVALVWTAGTAGGSAITDYVIEKSPDGTSWTTVSESVSTATSYTVTGLTNETVQYFRVSAVNAIGTSTPSNVLSATPTVMTWMFDYTDDADVFPVPGWTKVGGGSVLGTKSGLLCCVDGAGNYLNYEVSFDLYNVPATSLPTFKAEVVFDSTDDTFRFLLFCNADMSVRDEIGIGGDGSWIAAYQFGGTDGGSVTLPPFGSVMTIEAIATSTSTCTIKLNGVTLKAAAGLNTQVPGNNYVGLLLARGARVRKLDMAGIIATAQTWTGSAATETITASSGVWGSFTLPGAPTGVTGTAGSAQVSLTWTAPASTGGTPITGYVMEKAVSPPGTSFSAGGSVGAVLAGTVTGLTNGTAYVFRVAALNAVGQGPFSTSSSAYTPVLATTYLDDFNRADTTSPGDGGAGLGSAWTSGMPGTTPPSVYLISSNKATKKNGDHWTRYLQTMGSADHFVEADVAGTTGGDNQYLLIEARAQVNTRTDVYLGFLAPNANTATIGKLVGGTYSDVASGSVTNTGGAKLRLEVQGSAQRLYVNDVLIVSASDTSITSGNFVGVAGYVQAIGSGTYDNFRCGPL